MILKDIPGNRIRFPAGKTGHDGVEVAAYDAGLAVTGSSSLIQAVSRRGFDDDEFRRIVLIEVGKISDDGSGQRSDPGLNEDVCRPFNTGFFNCSPASMAIVP